jgi:acetyl-CoA carboxylase biotin carboxyl carrier protein
MMNWDNIKKIFRFIKNTDITEFQYEKDGEKIKIRRGGVVPPVEPANTRPANRSEPTVKSVSGEGPAETDDHRLFTLTSPIVGTFYRSPSPDDPPFVEIGADVNKGQVLCIIEAMKLMNEIESEVDGVLRRVLVENGQPVEYGEPLFLIEHK